MARPFRTQLLIGAGFLLVLFHLAVFFAARTTLYEQLSRVGDDAATIASSVKATAATSQLTPETIAGALDNLPIPDDGIVAIIDITTGAVVAGRGAPAILSDLSVALPNRMGRRDVDNVHREYAAVSSDDGLCRIVVGLPERIAWENTLPIYQRNAVNAGAWYLASFLTMYVFLARWTRSVRHLESVSQRVSEGDLSEPPVGVMASRELEQMQQSMVVMVARLRELQQQVIRQERLAAIGVLVSGVAHEINNPLQSILGSTQIIQAQGDIPESIRHDLTVIQKEGTRASGIIRNLSRFTRQETATAGPVRLTEIIVWLTELWRRRLEGHGIVLEVDDQSTKVATAVASELQQVSLNFLVNAEHAVLSGGSDTRRIVLHTRDTPDGFVRLDVEDSGPGVSPADEAKLFQPFFTTKPVGEGTGLGLSVSYGIIQAYGGRVGYERPAAGGARFFFEIPVNHSAGQS